ncbi:MAG: HAMP domain-containing histidine kinase [Oscillospiraceae bacterium]|nr:HAMP domain-containing histidine kinase [Oscillospiraceae bacterium]
MISFVVTCCMELFIILLQDSMGRTFAQNELEHAAKLTFGNVVLISLLLAVMDEVWRWFSVTRPVRHIIGAVSKIMNGDFSARIQPLKGIDNGDGFNTIIDYFNRMAEELSGIETLRTDFIANVSHELKTPLAVIQNYGTMLQTPKLSEENRIEYAKAVTSSSRRLADLITNILKLNRLENQQIYPEKKVYDLGEQLCECLLGFESTWEKKNIDIETDIEDSVLIESDPELLTLVWNNLFSNAMKFTEPGGKVSLSLKTDSEFAVVQVSDTGCGISPEVGQHIFEKFYQGDTSHATQGNGLGLALVKRVVDIVGGDISVSSELGKGSTFTVIIRRNEHGTVQEDTP